MRAKLGSHRGSYLSAAVLSGPHSLREPLNTPKPTEAVVNGERVVRVPIKDHAGLFAVVDAASFNALPEAARTGRWYLNANGRFYVKFTGQGGRPSSVARAVAKPRTGQVVTFRDGDHLNLRRSNLRVTTRRLLADWSAEPDYTSAAGVLSAEPTSGYAFATA